MILSVWFDHLKENLFHKEVQFKTFCPLVKTSYAPAENINGTPGPAFCFVFFFLDPYEDQFEKKNQAKKERVAKNEYQRLRNIARNRKIPSK